MGLTSFGWLLLIPHALMFQQDQYDIIFERMEVVEFNKSFLGFARTHNYKYNRTNTATTLTDEKKIVFGNELKLEVQAYRLASNEYREFPLRFMFDYCEYAGRKEFGLDKLYACGNSTGCPFKTGTYTSCAWAPNAKTFPPLIPGGSYMLDLKFFYRSIEVLFLQMYGTVKYPECKGC